MKFVVAALILAVGPNSANAHSIACAFQFPDGHFVGYNFDFVGNFLYEKTYYNSGNMRNNPPNDGRFVWRISDTVNHHGVFTSTNNPDLFIEADRANKLNVYAVLHTTSDFLVQGQCEGAP